VNIFRRLLLAVVGAVLAVQVASAQEAVPAPAAAPALLSPGKPSEGPWEGYQLQPGDVLQVSVWKEQELQSEVIIRPDGGISFPLAGDLPAAGRTVDQLRGELESRLRRLVPEAAVYVTVKSPQGNRVYVIGKVNKPGDFVLNRPTDVMQALSLAAGATPFADLNDIRVLRRVDGKQITIPFHYSDVARGRNLRQNIMLQGGDTVVVP